MGSILMTGLFATWCIGRFSIALPPLEPRGRSDTVQAVDIRLEATGTGKPEAAWQAEVARIERLQAPAGKPRALVRREAEPGGYGILVYHHDHYSPELVTLHTARAAPDGLVHFSTKSPTADPTSALARVRGVAKAFQVLPANTVPPGSIYCTGGGGVALAPGGEEGSELRLESKDQSARVEVEIKTVPKADPPGFAARAREISKEFASLGVKHRIVRVGPRRVAALDGEELVYEQRDGDQLVINMIWQSAGEPRHNAERPQVSISASFPANESASSAWEQMLGSLRLRQP